MKFPTDCTTDQDRAEYCELAKRELIKQHNAAPDAAGRSLAVQRLRIVGHWGAVYRKRVRLSIGEVSTEQLAFKQAAIKSNRWTPDISFDPYVAKALTRGN